MSYEPVTGTLFLTVPLQQIRTNYSSITKYLSGSQLFIVNNGVQYNTHGMRLEERK